MPETNHFVEVAVPLPIRKTFVYEVPPEMRSAALPGKGVWSPSGGDSSRALSSARPERSPREKRSCPSGRSWTMKHRSPKNFWPSCNGWPATISSPSARSSKPPSPRGSVSAPARYTRSHRRAWKTWQPGPANLPKDKILRALKRQGGKGSISPLAQKNSSPAVHDAIHRMMEEGWIKKEENRLEQKVKERLSRMPNF